MEDNLQTENTMNVNDQIKGYLVTASKWGKFLSIVGFIGLGFLVVFAIVCMMGLFPFQGMQNYNQSPFMRLPFVFVGFMYLGIAALSFFPVFYLYKFSQQAKDAVIRNDEETLTNGFENLKKMFTFYGIMTIVMLALYAIMLLFMVPMALLMNH
jgi:hypothetical protein